jgi:hypothetical protein
MALDITGFVTPEQTFPGLKEIGETMASAVKQKAAEKKEKQAGVKYLQSSLLGAGKTAIKDPNRLLSEQLKNEDENETLNIYETAYEGILSGLDPYVVSANAKSQLQERNNRVSRINQTNDFYEKTAMEFARIPGFNKSAYRENMYNALNSFRDESGNAIMAPVQEVIKRSESQDLISDAMNPMLEGNKDVWSNVAVTDVIDKAKPTTQASSVRQVGPNGDIIGYTMSTTIPNQFYQLQYNSKDKSNDLVPIGAKSTIQSDYLPAYKSIFGDEGLTNNVPTVSDEIYTALNTKSAERYLNQEAAKFEKSLIQNGIKTRDGAGNLIPSIKPEIETFKKAALYKALDEHSPALGYRKQQVEISKAPSASSAGAAEKKQSDERDRKAAYATLDKKWSSKKFPNAINIQDMLSGLNDSKGRPYEKRTDVLLVRQSPYKWEVQTFRKNPETGEMVLDKRMDINEFRTTTDTQNPDSPRKFHNYLEDYIQIKEKQIAEEEKKKAKKTTKAPAKKGGYLDDL